MEKIIIFFYILISKGRYFVFFFLLACSQIRYTTNQKIPVSLTQKKEHQQYFYHEMKVPFFLFGIFPRVNNIYLDEIAIDQNFQSISRLFIYERPSLEDIIYTLLTLGIYTPRSVTISSLGVKK